MSRALRAIDDAIERARQSARRTAAAAAHSLRSASEAQRAQQRATADKAAAHLAELEHARSTVAALLHYGERAARTLGDTPMQTRPGPQGTTELAPGEMTTARVYRGLQDAIDQDR